MEVENKIKIYEVNGNEVEIGKSKSLIVKSHWNRKDLVVLKFGKQEITVSKRTLEKAIDNAENWL